MMYRTILTQGFLAATLAAAVGCSKSEAAQGSAKGAAEPQAGEPRVVAVKVDDKGFTPSNVSAKKKEKLTLRFTRTTDDTCAKKVVFPELEVEKALPLNQGVDVDVPTDKARKLTFQCGMGMFKAALLVN